jgi:hypothetical protein
LLSLAFRLTITCDSAERCLFALGGTMGNQACETKIHVELHIWSTALPLLVPAYWAIADRVIYIVATS